MGKRINRKTLGEFFVRRKLNLLSLLSITLLSIVVTVVCLITGFIRERVGILVFVSVMLMILCIIQTFRMKSSFRTMKDFKGKRKKKTEK
ncbi:MAG: hypothetical protein IKU34_02845 [Clostridia bacterium]|nr:hypothetical protein [Clostridia bacterium]